MKKSFLANKNKFWGDFWEGGRVVNSNKSTSSRFRHWRVVRAGGREVRWTHVPKQGSDMTVGAHRDSEDTDLTTERGRGRLHFLPGSWLWLEKGRADLQTQ